LTTVEVVLGVITCIFLVQSSFLGMHLLNWIFNYFNLVRKPIRVAVDLCRALESERSALRKLCLEPNILSVILIFILLFEADYIHESIVPNGFVQGIFK